ncbi:hypothetical protein C8J57DRAFT_1526061 [Mycena rebaudengoi]|nr:hypothetical protein C8J57DRAFT_1526061 [Mycena rebaudengoi]
MPVFTPPRQLPPQRKLWPTILLFSAVGLGAFYGYVINETKLPTAPTTIPTNSRYVNPLHRIRAAGPAPVCFLPSKLHSALAPCSVAHDTKLWFAVAGKAPSLNGHPYVPIWNTAALPTAVQHVFRTVVFPSPEAQPAHFLLISPMDGRKTHGRWAHAAPHSPAHFAAPCPETAGGPLAARTTAYGISRRVRLPGIGVSSLLWCSLGARRANREATPHDPPPGCKL